MNIKNAHFVGTVNVARQNSIMGDVRLNKYNNKISNDLLKYQGKIGHEENLVLVKLMEENGEE